MIDCLLYYLAASFVFTACICRIAHVAKTTSRG
jgi:hypothetical protein